MMKLNATQQEIIAAGRKLAQLNPNAQQLKNAREWWAGGCVVLYSNQDFDVLNGLVSAITTAERKTEKRNYDDGYKAGYAGKEFDKSRGNQPGYEHGFDDGECDRPTLDELIPIDVAKERSTGCLS